MNNLKVDSIGSIDGGEFDQVDIGGVLNVKNDLIAREICIDGVINVKGNVFAREKITIDGVVELKGNLDGGIIDVDGVANIKGNIKGKKISVDGTADIQGERMEAEEIRGDGCLTIKGEVNADLVKMDGFLSANAIFGDHIEIYGIGKAKLLQKIAGKFAGRDWTAVSIKLIEGTYVEIDRTDVDEINAQQVVIHAGSCVKKVYATERITIESGAQVDEITGEAEIIYQ